jgi:uncharacterized protein with GYD domain
MASFITLVNYADQGIRNVKDSPDRFDAFRGMVEKLALTVRGWYRTVGNYDMVVVVEGDEEAATTALL